MNVVPPLSLNAACVPPCSGPEQEVAHDDGLAAPDQDAEFDPAFDDAQAGGAADIDAPTSRCAADTSETRLCGWIEQIADHDERALAELYDATSARVYGLVVRIVRRPAWAEEVVEDTYFQVWRQAVRFDAGRGRALAWLLGMARSRAIDMLRREARFRHETLDGDDAPQCQATARPADELLDAAQGHAELHRALLGLSAQSRQLLALAFFRGLSHEEITTQTALPLGTVKSQIRRALIALRAALGDGAGRALAA